MIDYDEAWAETVRAAKRRMAAFDQLPQAIRVAAAMSPIDLDAVYTLDLYTTSASELGDEAAADWIVKSIAAAARSGGR